MEQSEIIRMAREAGFTDAWLKPLERFASIVAAHERERVMNEPLTKAMWDRFESEIRADEREACAKVCKDTANSQFESGESETAGVLDHCAAAIRARGE